MTRAELSPTAPYLIGRRGKRKHCKSADHGGDGFDFGPIAFGNPMDLVGKAIKKRRETAEKYSKRKSGGEQARNNYHRKHG
jgi:hypothetical protein